MSNLLSLLFIACSLVSFMNVARLLRDKTVRGVSIVPTMVFITTNLFEVVYFGRLHDWMPVVGALAMFVSNVAWVGLAVSYRDGERAGQLFS